MLHNCATVGYAAATDVAATNVTVETLGLASRRFGEAAH